ncbi:hypothetical protein [Brevundimonas sp.]
MLEFIMRLRVMRQPVSALGLAILMATGLGVTSANAQFSHDAIQNRDIAHAQQMNDYAYTASQNYANSQYDDYYEEDSDDGYYSDYSPPAPLTLEQQYLLQSQQRDQEIMDELRADRRFERYINGGWDFYQARQPAEPGEYCAATYLSRHGIITLTGGDKSWDGGMLMFVGTKIPRPAALQEVTATLSQTGEPPATVRAFVFAANPAIEGFGTIAFAVPSLSDAARGTLDESEFVVHIDGQQVFRMSYKNGSSARDELQKCIRQR